MDLKNPLVSCSSFFLLQLFAFYLTSFLAQAARPPPSPPSKQYYHVVNLDSLKPNTYCESNREGSVGSALASRKGPCWAKYHNPAKAISYTRQHFQSEKAHDWSADSVEYYFRVGLGTPITEYNLFVDTGSDNTWVRCQPCTSGCKSNGPLFDPTKSKTYVNETCRSDDNKSVFESSYGDDSSVSGHWGCDTLTIIQKQYSYNNNNNDVVKNFQFGCAQEFNDTVGDNFGDDAGILGLGRGDLSLPSQAGFEIFGYCIPKSSSRLGYFVFGSEAAKMSSSSRPKFTKLVNHDGKPFYFVNFTGINVAGKKLDIDPSVFNSQGTIIDSGTTYTQLPQEAYSALTTAFNQSMASNYPAAAASSQIMPKLGTICYNVDGIDTSTLHVPPITFHFTGMSEEEEEGEIDVELRPSGIVMPSDPNLVCLGFTPQDKPEGLTIIGNHQQRQMGMFFDLQKEKRIGFGTNNCA